MYPASHLAVPEDLVHHLARHVGRDGEAHALIAATARQDGRIDPDQVSVHVHQGPAGVAGVNGGIGLDEIFVVLHPHSRPACGAHDSPW